MRTLKILFVAGTAISFLSGARAQLPAASQQEEMLQQRNQMMQAAPFPAVSNVPALYAGESSDVGPQTVVQMKPRRTWIEAFADAQYFYTDNMFLADHNKQSANVLVSTAQAAVAPTAFDFLGGQLSPRVGYQQQWFNYDLAGSSTVQVYDLNNPFNPPQTASLNVFDFSVSTVFGDVAWREKNWTFKLGADFRRLLNSGSYEEFYREYVPRWSVVREFPLTPATGLSVGYEGDYRVTKTSPPVPPTFGQDFNDRADNSLFIAGHWRLCRYAILQPFYRFEYSHYTQINRDDLLNSFGLTLYFPLTKNVTLRGFVGYDNLKTDGVYAQHYENLNAGGGLNLFVRF